MEGGDDIDVINFTDNHILAKAVEDDGFVWYLTGFMGGQRQMKSEIPGLFYLIYGLSLRVLGVV